MSNTESLSTLDRLGLFCKVRGGGDVSVSRFKKLFGQGKQSTEKHLQYIPLFLDVLLSHEAYNLRFF